METIINTEEAAAHFQLAFTVPVCLVRQQNTFNEALNIIIHVDLINHFHRVPGGSFRSDISRSHQG